MTGSCSPSAEYFRQEQRKRRELLALDIDAKGLLGEGVLLYLLRAAGYHCFPLTESNRSGAPMALGDRHKWGSSLRMPDYMIAAGESAYIEVKTKSQSVWFNKIGQWRHGFDKVKGVDYEAIQRATGLPVAIAIVELYQGSQEYKQWDKPNHSRWSGTILLQTLAGLGPPIGGFSDQAHMQYWPRDRFVRLAQFDAMALYAFNQVERELGTEAEQWWFQTLAERHRQNLREAIGRVLDGRARPPAPEPRQAARRPTPKPKIRQPGLVQGTLF